MSDRRLRDLQRQVQSDPSVYPALVQEWLRVGCRDPRRDPRVGDVVRQPGRLWYNSPDNRIINGIVWQQRKVLLVRHLRHAGLEDTIDWRLMPYSVHSVRQVGRMFLPSWRRWALAGVVVRIVELDVEQSV